MPVGECMPLIMNGLRRGGRGARRAIYILATCSSSKAVRPSWRRNLAGDFPRRGDEEKRRQDAGVTDATLLFVLLVVRLAGFCWERR